MRPGLFQLHKQAMATNLQPSPAHQEFLDQHFVDSGTAKWKAFKNKLRSPAFVAAVKQDDRADKKLKRYSEMNSKHMTARGVPMFKVPSQSSSKMYTVKFHPDAGRYTCNCGDWVHVRSVQARKTKQDCKHVQMVKQELQATGRRPEQEMEKRARGRAAATLRSFLG